MKLRQNVRQPLEIFLESFHRLLIEITLYYKPDGSLAANRKENAFCLSYLKLRNKDLHLAG